MRDDDVALDLKKDDRLEPHANMLDHASFFEQVIFPFWVLFWRRSAETETMHRNPFILQGDWCE